MKISTHKKLIASPGSEKESVHLKTEKQALSDGFIKDEGKKSVFSFVKNKGHQSVMKFAQELNINDIRQKGKSQNDNLLNLCDGTALFLALSKKNYEIGDDYVSKASLRLKVFKELQKKYPDEKIYFQEKRGLAEAGDGFYATLPVFRSGAGSVGMGFGFSAGVILRYRTSQPVVDNQDKPKQTLLPLTPKQARRMQAAQEFELCGQGRIRADVAITGRYGAGAGIAVAGAQAGLSAMAQLAAEYSINVMSLDGHNRVRVTLRRLDQESVAINASLLFGLIFPGNSIWRGNLGAPQVGHGLLKYFVEHKGSATVESYINDYTTLSLNVSLSHTHKGTHICSFDLDLSNPRAAKAYCDLMALDMTLAFKLADANNGVIAISLKESQHSDKAALRLALCSEKLFLAEALESRSHGQLVDELGSAQIYRDRTFKKHRENWFTGQRDIVWEAVEIRKDQEKAKTYYHFNYQKNDLFTRQREINRFFLFAKALGIKHACESEKKLIDMHTYKKLFTSADDTKLMVDLYFTSAGVERMRSANKEQMIQAFIDTRANLDPKLLGHPWLSNNLKPQNEKIFKLYADNIHNLSGFGSNKKLLHKLKYSYYVLNNRCLKRDYKVYQQACRFAQKTSELVAKDEKRSRIGKLFTSIGRSHSSHYATVIPTLTLIAGRDNVLVHTLSVSGGNVLLKSVDEGVLMHPRNELVNLCLRE